MLDHDALKNYLDTKVDLYNRVDFIDEDPISIPHAYTLLQDIEITAFWTSMLAWGQRTTIIKKANTLFALMDNTPYDFICNHTDLDLKKLLEFKHRTFNTTDTLYFIAALKNIYTQYHSMEQAFLFSGCEKEMHTENMLIQFHKLFFSLDYAPHRTKKHVSTPLSKSTCKRLNMFLRWMVRKDECGVDFGLWGKILPSQLICPLDLHVDRVARHLKLITRKQTDWLTTLELTNKLKQFDTNDPVKYDFALFGLGIADKMA